MQVLKTTFAIVIWLLMFLGSLAYGQEKNEPSKKTQDNISSHPDVFHSDPRETIFRQFDRNKNGVVEFAEWQEAQNSEEEEAQDTFYYLDVDRNGWISRSEFFSETKIKIVNQVLSSLSKES